MERKLSLNQVKGILDNASFTVAKTYQDHPHEYILSKNYPKGQWFEMVMTLRDHGIYEEWMPNIWYRYFYHNGHKYWTMDYPVHKTEVINRAKI